MKDISPEEPWEEEIFGEQSLKEALLDVDFPISKVELMNHAGRREIHIRRGVVVELNRLLEVCPHDYYDRVEDIVHCPDIEENIRAA